MAIGVMTVTVELTEEETEKGKNFLDKLLDNVYSAGVYDREVLDLTDYGCFNEMFEALMKVLGLEV